jgi:hypothetical protein
MHSSEFKIKGYKGKVVVNHNGDWSGDAIVMYQEAGVKGILPDKEPQEVRVPGKLLIALALPVAKKFVIGEVISNIEQIDVDR